MFVCLCNPVTDSQIRACATDGCASFREMACKLGVAQQCGRCACEAKIVFDEARAAGSRGARPRARAGSASAPRAY
jgi:bacterioferritin-associated ferredoxin